MAPMIDLLSLATCVGAGIIGGVFFAFSTFVMKALGQMPPSQGALAMQRINVVVLNPLFLGVFMGTAVLGVSCAVAAFLPWAGARSVLLLAAGVLYVIGTFGVTMALNVPRNEKLARMDAASDEARAYWLVYLREWTFWNSVRTAAAVVASACAAAALVVGA